jgi:hypothetical protein
LTGDGRRETEEGKRETGDGRQETEVLPASISPFRGLGGEERGLIFILNIMENSGYWVTDF